MASDIKANYSGKATLVPAAFFVQEKAKSFLSEVARIDASEPVLSVPVPAFDAVLVYSGGKAPEMLDVLDVLGRTKTGTKAGNKVRSREDNPVAVASYRMHVFTLAIRKGEKLLFCNMFEVPDFTSLEYHLFNVIYALGLSVQKTVIQFISPLSGEQKESLKKYCYNVVFK
ncbi:MAG: DUF3822 family protein [Bacteroidales bacterium]|nr:DUF3822 family protein [Bacteroidales bacterium]